VVKACSDMSNYELQVKNIKRHIPSSVVFINENKKFLDVLLSIAEKLRNYTSTLDIDLSVTNGWLFNIYYSNEKNEIVFSEGPGVFYNGAESLVEIDVKTLFSEYENSVFLEIMSTKMNSKKNNQGREIEIIIYADRINIQYWSFLLADLMIISPPIELPESDDYNWYEYGIKVNDDWGIYLSRVGKAN
jgi:hypothetical protein